MDIKISTFLLDDDNLIHVALKVAFKRAFIDNVRFFYHSDKFLNAFDDSVGVCIIDFNLNEPANGVDILQRVLELNPHCFVIGISNTDNIDVMISFMNNNTRRYVKKSDSQFVEKLVQFTRTGLTEAKRHQELINELKETHALISKLKNS